MDLCQGDDLQGVVKFASDGTVFVDNDEVDDTVAGEDDEQQKPWSRGRSKRARRARTAPGSLGIGPLSSAASPSQICRASTPVQCRLERKFEPVYHPHGQGAFRRAWLPVARAAISPSEMFHQARAVLEPEPGAPTRKSPKTFGEGALKTGQRTISTRGFGGYSQRCTRGSSFGGWLKNPDTPGPGAYKVRQCYTSPLMSGVPRSASCQPFSHSRWSRASREGDGAPGTRWQGVDPDVKNEFEYVKADAIKRSVPKSSISGSIVTNREDACAPGPATYLPSMAAVIADKRYNGFSKADRQPKMDPGLRARVNAGPKYVTWKDLGTGYPQAQCTFSRDPTGRLNDVPVHA